MLPMLESILNRLSIEETKERERAGIHLNQKLIVQKWRGLLKKDTGKEMKSSSNNCGINVSKGNKLQYNLSKQNWAMLEIPMKEVSFYNDNIKHWFYMEEEEEEDDNGMMSMKIFLMVASIRMKKRITIFID